MKAHRPTLAALGTRAAEKPARYRVKAPGREPGTLVDLGDRSVQFAAIAPLAQRVGATPEALLALVGIAPRTAARRRAERFLKPEEADRVLRVARLLEEAARVFGGHARASAWLGTRHPLLGGDTPLSLLGSDAGAKAVADELVRIDFGDFA